ncbi:MAG: hypothetical protein ABSB49_09530 [Polyangia bacterium]
MPFGRRWRAGTAGILVLLLGLLPPGCRRVRLARGQAAAVVVVAPAGPAPGPGVVIREREPNDNPDEAQTLAFLGSSIEVEGSLPIAADGKGGDVDFFKLQVPIAALDPSERRDASASASAASSRSTRDSSPPPGGPTRGAAARDWSPRDSSPPDSSPPEEQDPRRMARRLNLTVAPGAGDRVSLELWDEGKRVLESVTSARGEAVGMPNMAVQPGGYYYLCVRAAKGRAARPEAPAVTSSPRHGYRLSVEFGDFEVADEREPDDTLATAQNVAMTGMAELAGYHGWVHDEDFYRLAAPEVLSGLEVELDAVAGVTASLQVISGRGARLAAVRGRKGGRLSLHNVSIAPAPAEGEDRFFYVMVRSESGDNRSQRYVLHLALGALAQDAAPAQPAP